MNAALQIAQLEYDNRLPVEMSDPAEQEWIENGVEELMRGGDVQFKRFGRQAQGVTYERFATAVDEFAADQDSSRSVIGRLILAARRKSSSEAASAANEALNSPDPDEALREIARDLLRPLARDGAIAEQEDVL
ncbi:hypothetical protein [Pseudomonas sp.]|uniref:hypothetical protein n=1 Tax=Pseudomonas sp. TaxID=306 RepID=UPI00258CBEF2|nr:hypothetical protein [Pseudomonas sp.]